MFGSLKRQHLLREFFRSTGSVSLHPDSMSSNGSYTKKTKFYSFIVGTILF